MKHTSILLTLIVTAFIVGCQLNDDLLTPSHQQVAPSPSTTHRTTCKRVEIHGYVSVPGQFNSILEVDGIAEYAITLLPRDPIPPNPQYTLELGMIVKAKLHEIDGRMLWQTAGTSLDELGYNDGDVLSVTKRYWVANLNGGMWLHITFRVTADEIQAAAMWLQLPRIVQADEVN
jgi:hypothetical protein